MQFVFYDLETTGLSRRDEPIQFGAIITNEKLMPVQKCDFYCYTQVPISSGASAVHGITAKELRQLSNGQTFEDHFLKLPFVVNDAETIWCSYSTSGFDERMVNQALTHNGLTKYDFGSRVKSLDCIVGAKACFDAYSALKLRLGQGKDRKLEQYALGLGLSESEINTLYERATQRDGTFHDALFDAFVLWLVVYKNKELLGFRV